jgi:hypothetical protein
VSSVEELQIGIGTGAQVYRLDAVKGTATLAPALAPFVPPETPACADVSSRIRGPRSPCGRREIKEVRPCPTSERPRLPSGPAAD